MGATIVTMLFLLSVPFLYVWNVSGFCLFCMTSPYALLRAVLVLVVLPEVAAAAAAAAMVIALYT